MSLRHLATLQLDRDTVADSHNFLVGYAEMCVRESSDLPRASTPETVSEPGLGGWRQRRATWRPASGP